MILSAVESIYFPFLSVSPILIQLTPLSDVVKYSLIGRGEPPRAISIMLPSLHQAQLSGMVNGKISFMHTVLPFWTS